MRITTKSRYAIRAVYALVVLGGEVEAVPLKKISDYEGISLKYLEQIFSQLKKNNIVTSLRGITGGYVLSRRPEEITVKEIIYVMDGPVKPVDCIDVDGCDKADNCPINWFWRDLKKNVDAYFEKITLKGLLNRSDKQ